MKNKYKYFSPISDVGFKKLFASEQNDALRIQLLNSIITDGSPVVSAELLDPVHVAGVETTAVFDLYCQREDGSRIIVEMQRAVSRVFLNRALAYFGYPVRSEDGVSALVGKSVVYMCQNAVPKAHADDWQAVVDRFFVEYAVHLCDTTVPYPGMKETLHTLKEQGYTLAVVTNKPHPNAVVMIDTLLPSLFSRTISWVG